MLNTSNALLKQKKDKIYFLNRIVGVSYDTLTDDERNHLAHIALLVFDITPKAMRKIVNSCNRASKSNFIREEYNEYMTGQNNRTERKNFYDGLRETEREMLSNLESGFVNCDISFLYRLIKQYGLVERPTNGWSRPMEDLITKGDMVESLKLIRNEFVHRPHGIFSVQETVCFAHNMFNTLRAVSDLVDEQKKLIRECRSHIEWP